jgi:hypothetical protein
MCIINDLGHTCHEYLILFTKSGMTWQLTSLYVLSNGSNLLSNKVIKIFSISTDKLIKLLSISTEVTHANIIRLSMY